MSITKDNLLKIIDRALNYEEEAVHTISRNISAAVEFLEENPKIKKRITEVMNKLSSESEGHAKIMKDLKDKISKEKKDVY